MDNTSQPPLSGSVVSSSPPPLSEGAVSSPSLSVEAQDVIQMWLQQNSLEPPLHATSSASASPIVSQHSARTPSLPRRVVSMDFPPKYGISTRLLDDFKRAEVLGLPTPRRAGFTQPLDFGPLRIAQGSSSLASNPESAEPLQSTLSPISTCAANGDCQTEVCGRQTTNGSSRSHQHTSRDTSTSLLNNFRDYPASTPKPASILPKILLQETSNDHPNSSSIPRKLEEELLLSFKHRESCNDAEDGPMSFKPSVKLQMEKILSFMCSAAAGFRLPSSKLLTIAEYGACGSRSADLAQTFISQLSNQFFEPGEDDQSGSDLPEKIFFTVIHSDKPHVNFCSLQMLAEQTYLRTSWQTDHVPQLLNRVFASYTTADFGRTMIPPRSISVGFSLMDLHQIKTKPIAGTIHNQAELTAFLRARAIEFRQNGILILAFAVGTPPEKVHHQSRPITSRVFSGDHTAEKPEIAESKLRDENSATTSSEASEAGRRQSNEFGRENDQRPQDVDQMEPKTPHVWLTISRLIARTLQSLVAQGLLLPGIAVKMEQLPMHTRTAEDVRSALICVKNEWKLEWSYGLGTESYLNSILSSSEKGGEHRAPRHRSPPLSPPLTPHQDWGSSTSSDPPAEYSSSREFQFESSTIKAEPILTVQHPAQQKFQQGMVGVEDWIEHVVNFSRICYEGHFRSLLQHLKEESGKKDFGFVDNILEILWLDLEHRLKTDSGALESVRSLVLDITIIGLRRS